MTNLDWLFARQRFGVQPGLARVRALLERLGNPHEAFEAVLVGGTNGKGSTSAVLAGVLAAGGARTGLFTSPHLSRFSERFRVNGEELPTPLVQEALARVRPFAEDVGATFFEVVTALGALVFAEAGVRAAVMEVGLGGRLDATNVLEPVLSVVTNVGLDHTEVLGHTLEAIAGEKAGILRPGRPAVTGAQGVALGVLDSVNADLWALGRDASYDAEFLGWEGWRVRLNGPLGTAEFRTPLLGEHGARNAALAALAAQRLGVKNEALAKGAALARWPGRMERVPFGSREVLLDGAHNPDGAEALAAALRSLGVSRVPLVFGASGDKDVAGVARALEPIASEVILTRAALSPRAADPAALAALWRVPTRLAASPREALALLPPGLSVVAGSLYLVGEVRPLLLGDAPEARERWQ